MNPPTRIITDARGRIVETSPGAGDLLAIEETSLVGKPFATFVAEGRRREFRTLLLDLSRAAGPVQTSLELRRRDGAILTVDVEALAETTADRFEWRIGRNGAAANAPRAATTLALGAAPLGLLLSRLPIGIVSLNRQLDVEYLNPAARAQLEGAEVGSSLPDPWPDFDLSAFARRLFDLAPLTPQLVETRRGHVLEIDGIPGGPAESALLIVQDVTSRERRSRAEYGFVTNAAHELRTPIAAIASTVEVLQRGAKEKPEDRDLFLGHIERESERLGRLASALLLLARIQTGEEAPLLELVDVGPLLDEIAAKLEPSPRVTVGVSCDPGVAVLADRDLLRQAVWNVAANAARHTDAGRIQLSGRNLGTLSEIEILDTGPGIPEDEQERAFERFFRGGRRRAGDGFGLGLAIAREITHALGGRATLSSEPGLGTRVRLQVPSAQLVRT